MRTQRKILSRVTIAAFVLMCIMGISSSADAAKKATAKLGKGKIAGAKKSFSVNKKKKTVTIKKNGTYTISGKIGGYRVIVSKAKLKVTLKLKGVTATQTKYPCIYSAKSNTSVTINLVGKTTTRLKGPKHFALAKGKKEPDAVIFSVGNLTINGQGNLFVTDIADNGKAIVSKNTVSLKSGYCSASSLKIALRGKNVSLAGGTFAGRAQDTCIKSDQKVNITGGVVTANGVDKGIQGKGGVTITGGSISVAAAYKAGTKFEDFRGITAGVTGKNGKKAVAGSVLISGGTIRVRSYGDCIRSSRDITITGGNFQLTSTGDDGIQAKATLTMKGNPKFSITAKGKKVKGTVKNIASNVKYK